MSPSLKAFGLIRQYEGCNLTAYQDGGGVWTIGYGHTPAKPGQVIVQGEAEGLLQADVSIAARGVLDALKVSVSQPELDALVVFVFNVGQTQFAGSTLLKRLNAGDHLGAAREFDKWCMVGGKPGGTPVKGLLIRRMREALLFMGAE